MKATLPTASLLTRHNPLVQDRRQDVALLSEICLIRFVLGMLQGVEQVNVIRVVELEPLGDHRHRAAPALGQSDEYLLLQVRIEDFPNSDHDCIITIRPPGRQARIASNSV